MENPKINLGDPSQVALDATTGELSDRGESVTQPLTQSQRATVRQEHEDEWERFCWASHVAIFGRERAMEIARVMGNEGE